MAPNKGGCAKAYAHTVAAGITGFPIESVQNISVSANGNEVDTTTLAAAVGTCTGYTTSASPIKTVSVTLDCLLDLTATQQAKLWAGFTTGADVFVHIGFGALGAAPTFLFQANVSADLSAPSATEFQQVTFNLTNKDQVTIA